MSSASFKYDVAFSFASEDEALATDFNDLLQDQYATFLYSKKQEVLAGTDGEETFGTVFEKEARFVVILFRPKWGTTPWTRIEATAIRNRAFEEGYDFTLFIPTDGTASLPSWVPKNRLFFGLARWGLKGAASVIEARIRDAGALPRVESPLDQALRLKRKIDFDAERKQVLNSADGVSLASVAVEKLIADLAARAQDIGEKAGLKVVIKQDRLWIDICAGQGCLGITWNLRYSNSLDESYLDIGFWEGTPPRLGRMYFRGDKPRRFHNDRYAFEMGPGRAFGWAGRDEVFLPEGQMADHMLKLLLNLTHERQAKRPK